MVWGLRYRLQGLGCRVSGAGAHHQPDDEPHVDTLAVFLVRGEGGALDALQCVCVSV